MRLDACHATDRLYVEHSDEHQNQGGDLRFDKHGFFVGLEILNDLTGCRLALTVVCSSEICAVLRTVMLKGEKTRDVSCKSNSALRSTFQRLI